MLSTPHEPQAIQALFRLASPHSPLGITMPFSGVTWAPQISLTPVRKEGQVRAAAVGQQYCQEPGSEWNRSVIGILLIMVA